MILVLTLGRSGSSVCMQTLNLLGVNIAGYKFGQKSNVREQEEHFRLNPKGYFEDPHIYHNGLASAAFQELLKSGVEPFACKMDIKHLLAERQIPHWQNIADRITAICISYREPSEQAHSEFISAHGNHTELSKDRFMIITEFLKSYVDTFEGVQDSLSGTLKTLKAKTYYICYSNLSDPKHYVDTLVSIGKLNPSRQQKLAAISNIEPSLYRVKKADLEDTERDWSIGLNAHQTYENLRKLEKNC